MRSGNTEQSATFKNRVIMTEQEFFERTKLNVTEAEFKPINEMYLEAGESIDKDIFCKDYVKHSDSVLLKAFYEQADHLKDKMDRVRKYVDSLADFIIVQAHELNSKALRSKAIQMIGLEEYLKVVIEKGYELWEEDRADLIDLLQGHKVSFTRNL